MSTDVASIEALFALPFNDLLYRAQGVHRQHFDPNAVQISTLLSIKTGGCPEDCGYCPQASRYHTGVDNERQDPRFVQGDLHDIGTVAEAGPHDVVWCSGVLYHAPHPLLTLERLNALTAPGGTLVLATETLPRRGTECVFAPAPGTHPTHTEPAFRRVVVVSKHLRLLPRQGRLQLGGGRRRMADETGHELDP